ncbi:MAG: type II toxin-antitoxin system PemK/MazF family toxin [Coprobacillus sp.]
MNKYYTFKRGTVVMVDFSPQVGSEIKGKHFAIVLTKKDRNTNELLTVIPLTSKYHIYHIDFGNEIYDSIYKKLMLSVEEVVKAYCNLDDDNKEKKNELTLQLEMCNQISDRYKLLKEQTYGKPHQITTISKIRIVKPINRIDPIRKLQVSNEVMNKIDESIIALFTK